MGVQDIKTKFLILFGLSKCLHWPCSVGNPLRGYQKVIFAMFVVKFFWWCDFFYFLFDELVGRHNRRLVSWRSVTMNFNEYFFDIECRSSWRALVIVFLCWESIWNDLKQGLKEYSYFYCRAVKVIFTTVLITGTGIICDHNTKRPKKTGKAS